MATTRAVALLRGINVGGRNPVPMADLRDELTAAGLRAVATYIQSGNAVFATDAAVRGLEADLAARLERRFGTAIPVVVRTHRELRAVVADAPDGFGTRPDLHHSDVVFLKAPLTTAAAMRAVALRDGVDRAWPGRGVVYFERLSARRTESRLSRIMSTPEYQSMTIRNWTTTTKLLAMLDDLTV